MNKLQLTNLLSPYNSDQTYAAVIGALAMTPYLKYRGEPGQVREGYMQIVALLKPLLFRVNEVRPFEVQKAIVKGYELYEIRYKQAIFPNTNQLLDTGNELQRKFEAMTEAAAPSGLLAKLHQGFQEILKGAYNESK